MLYIVGYPYTCRLIEEELTITSSEYLDIVVPCFNPQSGWDKILVEQFLSLQQALPSTKLRCILVNDGSTKGVDAVHIAVLKESIEFFKYISYDKNRGKGYAIRAGIKEASSQIVAFTDIDFPYKISCFKEMIVRIEQGADLAIGYRTNSYYKKISTSRKLLSIGLRSIMKFFLQIPVTDTQSGLKVFNQNATKVVLDCKIDRYLFDMELVKLVARRRLHIDTVKLELRPGVILEPMSLRIVFTEFKNLLFLIFRR